MTVGSCVEEHRRVNPRRLLGRILRPGLFLWHRESGELAPVFGLHLPVELAERVELDLAQRGLDGRVILGGVVHEDARHGHGEVGGRAHHAGNAGRGLAFPVRPHDHVETGLGAVLLPKLAHLVGARVVHRDRPETVAKVGHLNDHRLLFERQITQPVNDILVRVCDEPLARINVTGQHPDLVHRANRHDAGEETCFGSLRELRPLVIHIDERPPPKVGHAAHHLHIRLCHRAGCGTRNFRGGLRNRDLLRLKVSHQHRRERCRSRRRWT